uniref:Uncharacterized protein n=1 Tax=Oryza brachyantha TaxID=4533 RepID=J3LPQ2_ORYBR
GSQPIESLKRPQEAHPKPSFSELLLRNTASLISKFQQGGWAARLHRKATGPRLDVRLFIE